MLTPFLLIKARGNRGTERFVPAVVRDAVALLLHPRDVSPPGQSDRAPSNRRFALACLLDLFVLMFLVSFIL